MARKKSSTKIVPTSSSRRKGKLSKQTIAIGSVSNVPNLANRPISRNDFDSISLNSYDSSVYSSVSSGSFNNSNSKCDSFDSESIVTVDWSDSYRGEEPLPVLNNCGLEQVDNFEETLDKTLDDAFNASTKTRRYQTRISSLKQITALVRSRYCYDQLAHRISTLSDLLERSLRQKRPDEISAACTLLSLVVATLGDEATSIGQLVLPQLETLLLDCKLAPEIRIRCAQTLSMLAYLTDLEYHERDKIMKFLISIVISNIPNNLTKSIPWENNNNVYDNEVFGDEEDIESDFEPENYDEFESRQQPHKQPESMLVGCLELWSFLTGSISDFLVGPMIRRHFETITQLLDSQSLSVRLVSGETVALLMERFGSICEKRATDFVQSFPTSTSMDLTRLKQKLGRLATDGQKFRGKSDLRKQRSIFRKILQTVDDYIDDDNSCELASVAGSTVSSTSKPNTVIRFGAERIVLDTWIDQRNYAVLCQLFGPSFNTHLAYNNLIREIFNLGPPILTQNSSKTEKRDSNSDKQSNSVTKLQRHLQNEANKKALKVGRNRQRRNRSDKQLFAMEE